jgi:hypothetical protein
MSDLLLLNADIRTMNGSIPHAKDILIFDGEIKRVGENLVCPCIAETIDLSGRTVLPAFRDAHVHFFQTGIRLIEFDGGACKTEEELFSAMSDWLATHDGINGYGYSPQNDGALPSKISFDKISKTKPIFIRRIDGHSSCVNTAALNLILNFVKGKDSFDFEKGHLFGESHIEADRYFLGRISRETLIQAAFAVAQNALKKGCASVAAMVPKVGWMKLLLELDLPIRTVPWLETLEPREASELLLPRVGGCMPMVDGSFGSHSALLLEDYSDKPICKGIAEISQENLNNWIAKSGELKLQTAIHAIGDGAVEMVLNAIEKIPIEKRPPNTRIEHAELLNGNQIEKLSKNKISLAVQPVFEELWGGPEKLYSRRLGERWRKTNRYRDLLDAGVVLAGSSDSYITPIDPLRGIIAAMNHPNPEQRISLEEAISMFTIGAAIAEGMDDKYGTLEPGKSADLVVLSGNLDNEPIEKMKIEMTIVGGEIRFKR